MVRRPLVRPRYRPQTRGGGFGLSGASGGGNELQGGWWFNGSSVDLDMQNNLAAINSNPTGLATSQLTLTRTTSGMAQQQNGTWVNFTSGQFRRTDKGLLIEEARTNNILQCRDMTNAAWTKGATITVAQNQTGIDGAANSATLVTGGATSATNTVLQAITLGSAAETFSIFLKRVTGSGTVNITTDGGTTWTPVALTTSFQQFAVTQTLANPSCGIQIITNGDQVAADFSQLETGSFATSPILTTASAATRNADLTSGGATMLATLSGRQGTWYAEASPRFVPGANSALFYMSQQSSGTEWENFMRTSVGNNIEFSVSDAGFVTQADLISSGAITANTAYRCAAGYANNNFGAAYPASIQAGISTDVSGTNATANPTPTIMAIGSVSGVQYLNGYLRRMVWFASRQTNAQLLGWAQGTIGP